MAYTPRRVTPLVRGRRHSGEASLRQILSQTHQERGVVLRPNDDPTLVARSVNGNVALLLLYGTWHLRRPIVIDVPGVSLYGYGQATFQRAEAFSDPMIHVTAANVSLDGIVLDDDAGSGPAVRFENVTGGWANRLRILAGPGAVALGTGIHLVNADECMVARCRVETSAPARPLAEIYLDDASDDCSLVANVCPGGVISYLGASGTQQAGNIGTVTVR